MKSMTGFGSAAGDTENGKLQINIRGYNSRFFDLVISLPPFLMGCEEKIRRLVNDKAGRGKVELSVAYQVGDKQSGLIINRQLLNRYRLLCEETCPTQRQKPTDVSALLTLPGVIDFAEPEADSRLMEATFSLITQVLDDFDHYRQNEGEKTRRFVLGQIELIEQKTQEISKQKLFLEKKYADKLKERFQQLFNKKETEQLQPFFELAQAAVSCTISEELERLVYSCDYFREVIQSAQPVGKKLDFICQELNREINTIAAKTASTLINRQVVEVKEAIENIREQLRNIV